MQEKRFFTQKKTAIALCFVLLMLIQQVCAGPLGSQDQSKSDQGIDLKTENTVHALRRLARMTPLWRIMNSKPFGAFCQNNYECSTGICRAGLCTKNSYRAVSEPVKY